MLSLLSLVLKKDILALDFYIGIQDEKNDSEKSEGMA